MARKEKNPIKTIMMIQLFLTVAIIAVIVLLPKKIKGDKVGYAFLSKNEEETAKEPSKTEVQL